MSSSSEDEHAAHHAPPSRRRAPKKNHKEVVSYTHFEEVLARVNPMGPYQIFACFCIVYASIEWAGNYTFMDVLGSLEPDWNCTLKSDENTFVLIEEPTDKDKCNFIKANCSSITSISDSVEFHSLVAAMKLICDDEYKAKLIRVIQAAGSLIGSIVGGHFGDHFGRKYGFAGGQVCIIITSMFGTAAKTWFAFAILQGLNGFLYGVIEVTSLTLMMEYTSNKYRLIPNACFQWPLAYMVIALIAFLTKDWQYFFVYLNLVTVPICVGFMLFLESPRWLVASNRLEQACEVLNDLAHQRWNDMHIKFTTEDLRLIPRQAKPTFYSFFDLFKTRRFAKQSFMQILSMFTFSIVSSTYLYTVKGMHDSAVMFIFLDGLFRLFMPLLVIALDYKFTNFGRKMQFVGSLVLTESCLVAVLVLLIVGKKYDDLSITILVIIATMINDCVFWMNIVQITTQRYPTVIRCIAFGCLHSIKHLGVIVSLLTLKPILDSHTKIVFIVPTVLVLITLLCGVVLQPETKGKALMDTLIEGNFGRFENEIPKALLRLAAGHRFATPNAPYIRPPVDLDPAERPERPRPAIFQLDNARQSITPGSASYM